MCRIYGYFGADLGPAALDRARDAQLPGGPDQQDRIFGQDHPILESQRPELLPLDLAAELNVRADRAAVSACCRSSFSSIRRR